jgi:hypothetical protein
MPKLPWAPWHKAVKLREELRSGDLPLHMFAADLYEVMVGDGKTRPPEEVEREINALLQRIHEGLKLS